MGASEKYSASASLNSTGKDLTAATVEQNKNIYLLLCAGPAAHAEQLRQLCIFFASFFVARQRKKNIVDEYMTGKEMLKPVQQESKSIYLFIAE